MSIAETFSEDCDGKRETPGGEASMMDMTPELRRAIEKAGDQPVALIDPLTNTAYDIVRADPFEQVCKLLENWDRATVEVMYPLIDEAFREGWDTSEMAEYDDYEKHRP